MKKAIFPILILLVVVFVGASQYNGLVSEDENVKKTWADVNADYQRRYDLIGNLVATVKNAANFEKGTLTDVIEARSKANAIQLSVDDLTPENIQKFQAAQEELNQSFLGRMNFLQENYPQLTATAQFKDLNVQIEGTENRIKVARMRYNEAVQTFNKKVRSFPTNLMASLFGFSVKSPFASTQGAEKAPSVSDEFKK